MRVGGPGSIVPLLVLERAQVLGRIFVRSSTVRDVELVAPIRAASRTLADLQSRAGRSAAHRGLLSLAAAGAARATQLTRPARGSARLGASLGARGAARITPPARTLEHARQVRLGDQHLARLRALVAGDDRRGARACRSGGRRACSRPAGGAGSSRPRRSRSRRRAATASSSRSSWSGSNSPSAPSSTSGSSRLEQLLVELGLALLAPSASVRPWRSRPR